MLGESRKRKGSGNIISAEQVKQNIMLAVGIDVGSTETRVSLADANDLKLYVEGDQVDKILETLCTTHVIPSSYANIADSKEIVSVSSNLEDNYDSTIICVSNNADKPILSKHRVIRGRKISDAMGAVPRYLDSSTNKSDNIIFYTNVIDAIGYAVLHKFNGAIPTDIEVYMSLSVRPKELNSFCTKKMKDNFIGKFMFMWKDVTVNINIKDITFTTEPQAQIDGTITVYDLRSSCGDNADYYAGMADNMSESDCFIHIEGGGSSIGVEVVKNGNILDAASQTFPLGGNYLAQLVIDAYREKSGRTVTKEAANNAIVECSLRDGRNVIDITDIVISCKNRVGMDILERLRHEVVDIMSDLTLTDVEFVTLGGRLFLPDASGNTIGKCFEEYLHQISGNTEVIILNENFIPQGNLINCINLENFMPVPADVEEDKISAEEEHPTWHESEDGSQSNID